MTWWRHRHTEITPCKERGRDWSDAVARQGTSLATRSWKRQAGDFQREPDPANTLISEFWSPELWDNTFLLLWATQFGAFYMAALGNTHTSLSKMCSMEGYLGCYGSTGERYPYLGAKEWFAEKVEETQFWRINMNWFDKNVRKCSPQGDKVLPSVTEISTAGGSLPLEPSSQETSTGGEARGEGRTEPAREEFGILSWKVTERCWRNLSRRGRKSG